MLPEQEKERLRNYRAGFRRCIRCGTAYKVPAVPERCDVCGASAFWVPPTPADWNEMTAVAEYVMAQQVFATMDEIREQQGDSNAGERRRYEDARRNRRKPR